jgi:membrane protein required for colicin V production
MNLLDLFLFAPLAYGAYKGYKRGLIMSLFMLLAIVVGLYAAFQLNDFLVDFGIKTLNWQKTTLVPLCFIILFLGIGAGVYFGGKLLETALKVAKLSVFNNLAGALLGLLQWMFLIGTLLVFVLAIDQKQSLISDQKRKQSLAIPFYTQFLKLGLPRVSEAYLFESYLQQVPSLTESNPR